MEGAFLSQWRISSKVAGSDVAEERLLGMGLRLRVVESVIVEGFRGNEYGVAGDDDSACEDVVNVEL